MAKGKRVPVSFNRKKNEFVGIDEELMAQLKNLYKNVDIEREFSKMALWLTSEKGTARKGNIGFIMAWLERTAPTPLTTTEHLNVMQSETPLGNLLRDYLAGLWKNREHLLEFNTIRR